MNSNSTSFIPISRHLALLWVAVCSAGNALGGPQISVSPPTLTAEVVTGTQGSVNLRIDNLGDQALHWNVRVQEETGDLESVLSRLNSDFASVNSLIPNRFDFFDGVTGFFISDGGSDMFDTGNRLQTNFGSDIPYSDNVIRNDFRVGPSGRYFTRKHPGLFVFTGDLDNATLFGTFGGTHDGIGTVNGTVLTATRGGIEHRGFVKRVFNSSEPSVNHIVILADSPGASQNFSTSPSSDDHRVTGFSGSTRVYYLLFGTNGGSFVNDAQCGEIFKAFLDVAIPGPPAWIAPATSNGVVIASGGIDLPIQFNASGLVPGDYTAKLVVQSTDPVTPEVLVDVELKVKHPLDFDPDEISASVVMGQSTSQSVTITNTRNQPISWRIAGQLDLEETLESFNQNASSVTSIIPDRFDFFDGVFGSTINDGGGDMFDGGNALRTNLNSSNINYSDNAISSSSSVGASGRYFTRKVDGLFLFAADLEGVNRFDIVGNTGHDGAGTVSGVVLTGNAGGRQFKGFVKRSFNAFSKPSINHLIIVEDRPGLSHTFNLNTDNDFHRVEGITGSTRLYYLLYSARNSGFIDDDETQAIMDAFLRVTEGLPDWVSPGSTTGTVGANATQTLQLDLDASNLDHGTYEQTIGFTSAGPTAETVGALPISFVVAPALQAQPTGIAENVQSGSTSSSSFSLTNVGPRTITWSHQGNGLETVLSDLNQNSQVIVDEIPNRFDFFDGVTGTRINDGGSNMYDGGNFLNTSLGTSIPYSDDSIRSDPDVGPNGLYFTRKFQGLFVFAADLDGATFFEISGNLGANGNGQVDSAVLTASRRGTTYKGFVKRVFGAGVPSVNHLVIVEDRPGLSHAFPASSDNDRHLLAGLSGTTRIYYLLYGGTAGAFIDNSATQTIMDTFLDVVTSKWLTISPSSGRLDPGESDTVQVQFDASSLLPESQFRRDLDIRFGHSFLTGIPLLHLDECDAQSLSAMDRR